MPEVETTEAAESLEAPETEVAEAGATPRPEDVATLKARLAGKDRAYTTLKAEHEQSKQLSAELSRWKAEKEAADMTEVERKDLRIAELEASLVAKQAEAKSLALAQEFPRATELLGSATALMPEDKLAAIEERLKLASEAEAEPVEPVVNPNNPPRGVGVTSKSSSIGRPA